jgi:hypothetical protein
MQEPPWAAHTRCRPRDVPCDAARRLLESTQKAHAAARRSRTGAQPQALAPVPDATSEAAGGEAAAEDPRVATLRTIMGSVGPVFHQFFLDFFPSPDAWAAGRTAYTRYVALLTSMVVYVAGIGDRHPNTILVDTVTGEVMPIDFGLAFEQGRRLLPTDL